MGGCFINGSGNIDKLVIDSAATEKILSVINPLKEVVKEVLNGYDNDLNDINIITE